MPPQLIPERRMRNTDNGFGPFPDRFVLYIDQTVLRAYKINIHARGGHGSPLPSLGTMREIVSPLAEAYVVITDNPFFAA